VVERVIIIGVVVLMMACAAAIWKRNRIRAWWWAQRLSEGVSPGEQAYLMTRLAGLRGDAAPAMAELLNDDRPEIRVTAAGLLAFGETETARRALVAALNDAHPEVRDEAAHALAFGHGAGALPLLEEAMTWFRGSAAVAGCVAIGRTDGPRGEQLLVHIAETHSSADVRAQAAELIGMRRARSGADILNRLLADDSPVTAELYGRRRASAAMAQASVETGAGLPRGPGAATRPASESPASRSHARDGRLRVSDVAGEALDRLAQPDDAPIPALPSGDHGD
jgi:hypothetical protein